MNHGMGEFWVMCMRQSNRLATAVERHERRGALGRYTSACFCLAHYFYSRAAKYGWTADGWVITKRPPE